MKRLTYTQARITFNGREILIPGSYTKEEVARPIQEVKGTLTLKVKGIETSERSKKG